jgi:hypothetical protein
VLWLLAHPWLSELFQVNLRKVSEQSKDAAPRLRLFTMPAGQAEGLPVAKAIRDAKATLIVAQDEKPEN